MQLQGVAEPGRLHPVSAEVRQGEIVHLVGPNGAGKSTLLARMAGLSQGAGQVALSGRALTDWPAPELARHRAYLTQHQTPPFAMPVWHYLTLHQPDKTQHALQQEIAEKLGLADKLARPVNQLSGGEWQRVRLAAVVLQIHPKGNPDGQLLLLDEPMNSLDVAQQSGLDKLLTELRLAGVTVVMSSHDLNHTLRFASQTWLLRRGQMLASGDTPHVLTIENLTAAYDMPFKKLNADGVQILISAL
ncbi:vitamin B12 ABC transporter ATP-binding protein BtuD [Scandinavium goeteborgense]|uniref:Vitamin B12 import ATP-binding protein BtuD n=1 Tax=Scandinavium goeteborgense TaxID=1851514 RepID=A0A4R6EMA6_SCAGO|nr:vitamin B12 transport system ATP-binding protein [Scandinavium goeteborgense]